MGIFKKIGKVVKKVAVPAALAYGAYQFGAPLMAAAGAAGTGGSALGGAGGILGPLISGGLGYLGQQSANEQNLDIARMNSAFNASQADNQMAFQERMANTTWQRGVQDMQAAGLNPMLAYSQGGNPAPSGAAGSAVQPAEMRNSAGAGVAAAAQAASLENTQAQTDNIKADTDLKRADMKDPKAERGAAGDLPTKSFRAASEEARSRQLHYEAKKTIAEYELTVEQRKLVMKQIENAVDTGANIRADTRDTTANAVLRELAKADAENRSKHQMKYPGYNIDVKPFIGDAGSALNSAGTAFSKFHPASKTFTTVNNIRR